MRFKLFIATIIFMTLVATGINTRRLDAIEQQEVTFNSKIFDSCVIVTDGNRWGSGVAIRNNLILTAGHVVDVIWDSYIVASDGTEYEVIHAWQDEKYDVGFLVIDGKLPYLSFGDVPDLLDEVYLVGTPKVMAFQNYVSKGLINKLNLEYADIGVDWTGNFVCDFAGYKGGSGSPVFNEDYKIVGIYVGLFNYLENFCICEPVTHIRECLKEFDEDYKDYVDAIIVR